MGYFPNGTAGGDYHDRWCSRCLHDVNESCPIWLLHLLYNYEECNKEDSYLHVLIPLSKDKLDNERCTMFVDSSILSNLALQQFQHSSAQGRDK